MRLLSAQEDVHNSLDPAELLECLRQDTKDRSSEVLRGSTSDELLDGKVADRLSIELNDTSPGAENFGIVHRCVL